jgi:hypothetical protein
LAMPPLRSAGSRGTRSCTPKARSASTSGPRPRARSGLGSLWRHGARTALALAGISRSARFRGRATCRLARPAIGGWRARLPTDATAVPTRGSKEIHHKNGTRRRGVSYGLACDRYVGQTAGIPQISCRLAAAPKAGSHGPIAEHSQSSRFLIGSVTTAGSE